MFKNQKSAYIFVLTIKNIFEGKARRQLFRRSPPKIVFVASGRLKCAMNGDFDSIGGSAAAYAWFVWEKGFKGEPVIRWFN